MTDTPQRIEAGNKLIAEFMLGIRMESPDVWADKLTCEILILGEYLPHKHWNQLMPVVEKINAICHERGYELSNHSRDQEHLENQLDNPNHWKSWSYRNITLSTNINHVWNKVVQFIEWYNQTKEVGNE